VSRAALVALTVLCAPLAAQAYSTEVSTLEADINERTDCPPNRDILGGGMDPTDASSLAAAVLYPLDEGVSYPASFTVVVRDFGGPHDSYRIAAICGSLPDREIVDDSFPAPAGGVGIGIVQCPLGKVAVSGGVSLGGSGFATDFSIAALAPHFPQFLFAPDLTSRAPGEHPAPQGWKAAWRNDEGAATTGRVAAVCVSAEDVVTVVEDDTVEAGSVRAQSVFCPAGMTALGGGADAIDRTDLRTTSSAPVFAGFPFAVRLSDRAEGPAPDPIGWRVALRNDSASAKAFQVAAVCAPEPATSAGAAFSIAALVALRRRRG